MLPVDAEDPGKGSTRSAYSDGVQAVNKPELGSKCAFAPSPNEPDMVNKVVEFIAIVLDNSSKRLSGA